MYISWFRLGSNMPCTLLATQSCNVTMPLYWTLKFGTDVPALLQWYTSHVQCSVFSLKNRSQGNKQWHILNLWGYVTTNKKKSGTSKEIVWCRVTPTVTLFCCLKKTKWPSFFCVYFAPNFGIRGIRISENVLYFGCFFDGVHKALPQMNRRDEGITKKKKGVTRYNVSLYLCPGFWDFNLKLSRTVTTRNI